MPAIRNGVIRHYVGDAAISWVDCDDVAEVAAAALVDPASHAGRTYRLASDVKSFRQIADTLTQVVGRPFSYQPRPPEEFLEGVVTAGSDPAYMRSTYENYVGYTAGHPPEPGADFAILQSLLKRNGATWNDFGLRHAEEFR